jgi:hypothetical protein
MNHDRPSANHSRGANVRHDDGAVSNPAISAHSDWRKRPALFLHWASEVGKAMLPPPGQQIDVAANGDMIFQLAQAQSAAIADIHALANGDSRMGQRRAKPNVDIERTSIQGHAIKRPAQKDANAPGDKAEQLGTSGEKTLAPRLTL